MKLDIESQWRRFLEQQADERRPGLIGNFPYLLYVRLVIFVAALARSVLPNSHWVGPKWLIGAAIAMMAFTTMVHYVVVRRIQRDRDAEVERPVLIMASMDLLSVSALYYAAGTPTSDFYLFFYLPLLETTEHLRMKWTLTALGGAAIGMALALWAMPGEDVADRVVLYVMRVIFLGCFMLVALMLQRVQLFQYHRLCDREKEARHSLERQQLLNNELQQRQTEMSALLDEHLRLNNQLRQRRTEISGLLELSRQLGGEFEESRIVARAEELLEEIDREGQLIIKAGIRRAGETAGPDVALDEQETAALLELSERSSGTVVACHQPSSRDLVVVPLDLHHMRFGSLWAVGKKGAWQGEHTSTFWTLAAQIIATALARARRIGVYREISQMGAELARQDFEVEKILRRLAVQYRFEFACLALKDKYTNRVRMVRARNVPPGWMSRSDYSAEAPDILADVVRTGKTEIISGKDPNNRFNEEIFEKFGHEQLIRMYTPILVDGEPVGVLEVGGHKDRTDVLLTKKNQQAVTTEAGHIAKLVDGISDYRLIEKIAEKAIDVLGAGAAVIHVYQQYLHGERVVLQAGQGSIGPEQVRDLGSRCTGKKGQEAEAAVRAAGIPVCRIFPIDVGPGRRGQLALLYHEKDTEFTESDRAVTESFARLVESAIWTAEAIRETRTRAKLGWTASSLQCVLQSLVADPEAAESVPQRLAYHLQAMLDADIIVLYERLGDGRLLKPVRKGKFNRDPEGGWTGRSALVAELLEKGEHRFFTNDDIERMEWRKEIGFGQRFAIREGIQSCAGLVLRPREGAEAVGVLFANYRKAQEFDEETKSMMETLAQTAALALRTAQINERFQNTAEQWEQEMAALADVEKLVLEHRDANEDEILRKILNRAVEVSGARHGVILKFDPQERKLISKPGLTVGFKDVNLPEHSLGEGLVGESLRRGEPILLSDVEDLNHPDQKFYHGTLGDTGSQVTVPLVDGTEPVGVFSLEHPVRGHFKKPHLTLLETLALQAMLAIRTVKLTEEVEQQQAPLFALAAVAGRIREHQLQGDSALRMVLTGITAGTGMGFNRAAIYAIKNGRLTGRVAIGPIDKDEWESISGALPKSAAFGQLLDEAENFGLHVEASEGAGDSQLSKWVKARLIEDSNADSLEAARLPGEREDILAWVEVRSRESEAVLGYIAADRIFSAPKAPVTDVEILMLKQFGAIAADALRREDLNLLPTEDREWHEHFKGVLHDTVPYFARAREALRRQAYELVHRHTSRGIEELGRLKGTPWTRRPVRLIDLVSAISEVRDLHSDILIEWQPPGGEVLVAAVQSRIENAFAQLFDNAREQRGSGLRISVRLLVRGEEDAQHAEVEVEDNAGGRLEEIQDRLFRRGKSDKGEGRGYGTGLVKATFEEFGGRVQYAQGAGGIVVNLRLPVAPAEVRKPKAKGAGA